MGKSDELRTIERSALRKRLGECYYALLRYLLWLSPKYRFAKEQSPGLLPFLHARHQTLLLRPLKDIDMQLQHNKIVNLRLAARWLDGVLLRPGETLSFWRLVGRPTYAKGYLDGMVLSCGKVTAGVGGGLCQLSNLLYWITLHTPLTVVERHRHGYDVFPDVNRTQPFGSGATCFYPHGDLMIVNRTGDAFQLSVSVGKEYLCASWHSDARPVCRYEMIERDHMMKSEWWGGYSRHNALYRRRFDLEGAFLGEEFIVENHAMMMYEPFLPEGGGARRADTH